MQELKSEHIFYVHILSQYLMKEFDTYYDIVMHICRFFRPNIMIKSERHLSVIIDGKLLIANPYEPLFKSIDIPNVYDVSVTDEFTFILTKTGTYILKPNHRDPIHVNSDTYKSIKTSGTFGLVLNHNNTVSGNCYFLNDVIYRARKYATTDQEIGQFHEGVGDFNRYKLQDVVSMECGMHHAMVITHDGLYGWGSNDQYQLGLGHAGEISEPTKIDINDIVKVSCGLHHTMALDVNGNLYGFGSNYQHQITDESMIHYKLPHKLELTNVINVKCGLFYSMALTHDGKLYGWGGNEYCKNRRMSEINFKLPIIDFSCGKYHALILTANFELYKSESYNRLFEFCKIIM